MSRKGSTTQTTSESEWVETGTEVLSANRMYLGRKVKTHDYKKYERGLLTTLPDILVPAGDLHLKMEVRYKRRNSDLDNAIKPFLDILQKRYGFNDSRVQKITAIKRTDTENPGIKFKLEQYDDTQTK